MTAVSWQHPTATYSRERQDVLARPKNVPPAFLEDRRSVYWVDKQPATGPTKFGIIFGIISIVITVVEMDNDLSALTKRQEELVQHKTRVPSFVPDRFSPMWQVSLAAMQATPSKRICQLAKYKPFHRNWIAMRSYDTHIPHPALHTAASDRLESLAQPKTYQPLPIKSNSEWDWGEWAPAIPKEAKNHVASARLEQLAEPRSCPEGYLDNRPIVWPVAKTAMQMQATTRLQQLARPKTRQALDQDYDPYRVSFAARMAVPSPRVEDLAVPIPRKVRTKKTA